MADNTEQPLELDLTSLGSKATDWSALLSRTRDLLLAGAAATYFLGYLVCAIHAYTSNLRLRRPAEAEYFVAGAPMLLLLIGMIWLFFQVQRLSAGVYERAKPPLAKSIRVAAGIASVLIFLVLRFVDVVGNRYDLSLFVVSALNYATELLFAVTVALLIGTDKSSRRFSQPAWMVIPLSLLTVDFSVTYAQRVYPAIPQQLGGAAPRCVIIGAPSLVGNRSWQDLVLISKFDDQGRLRSELTSGDEPQDVTQLMPVIRSGTGMWASESGPVWLLDDADDYIIVSAGRFRSPLELPRSNTLSILYDVDRSPLSDCPVFEP